MCRQTDTTFPRMFISCTLCKDCVINCLQWNNFPFTSHLPAPITDIYTWPLFDAPLVLCRSFNTPCQYTPILKLCPLIFGLTPYGRLHSIMLTTTYSIISYGKINFDLHLLDSCPLFQEHK